MSENGDTNGIRWLTVILSIVAMALLVITYILWHPSADNKLGQLIIDCIPSAIVVLVAIPIVYFIFESKGLGSYQNDPQNNYNTLIDMVSKLQSTSQTEDRLPQVLDFCETYRHVDWNKLISGSNNSIDIIVYYFDSWVNANHDDLVKFFRKSGTKIRIFVADPDQEELIKTVSRLFPEYSEETVREKIARTGERILQAIKEAGGDPRRLEFYYVPFVLNYSAQCLDGNTLVLSIFEMFRQQKIDSPAIILDLSQSDHLRSFWHKELAGLIEVSKRVELS